MNEIKNTKQMNIIEHFYSIQGEGLFCGQPSYFIRMGICPLRCSFCDSKFTWKTKEEKDLHAIYNDILLKSKTKHIVITGGEPFYQLNYWYMIEMVKFFTDRHFTVTIETTGIYDEFQIVTGSLLYNLTLFEEDVPSFGKENIYFSISPKFNIEAYSDFFPSERNNVSLGTTQIYDFYNLLNWKVRGFENKRKYFYYKFVYNKNTEGLIEDFIRHYVPEELYDNVFIMPETPLSNLKEKNNNMEEAAEFCKKIGVRYSPRIHVDIWGLQKGR